METIDRNYQLSRDDVDFFVANGYLGPFAAMSPSEMAVTRAP